MWLEDSDAPDTRMHGARIEKKHRNVTSDALHCKRETGIGPATFSLARRRSTTLLLAHSFVRRFLRTREIIPKGTGIVKLQFHSSSLLPDHRLNTFPPVISASGICLHVPAYPSSFRNSQVSYQHNDDADSQNAAPHPRSHAAADP
jgi:hypothetical protein